MILSIKLVILLTVKTDFPENMMKVFLLNFTDVLLRVVHFCSLLMEFYTVSTLVSLKWDARVAPILNYLWSLSTTFDTTRDLLLWPENTFSFFSDNFCFQRLYQFTDVIMTHSR